MQTFGVPNAEIIPIEPDAVNTDAGKCYVLCEYLMVVF